MPPSEGHRLCQLSEQLEEALHLTGTGVAGEEAQSSQSALLEGSYWTAKGAGNHVSHQQNPVI